MLNVGDIKEFRYLYFDYDILGICLDINDTNVVLGYIANSFYIGCLKLSNLKYKDIKIEPELSNYFNRILNLYNDKKVINNEISNLKNKLNIEKPLEQKQSFFSKFLKKSPSEEKIALEIYINNKIMEKKAVLSQMEIVGNECLDCYIKLKRPNMEILNFYTIKEGQIKEFIQKRYNSEPFIGICLGYGGTDDYANNVNRNPSFPQFLPDNPDVVILSIESENGKYFIKKRKLETSSNNYLIKDIRFNTPGLRDSMYHMYILESKIVECIVKYKEMMTEYTNEQSMLNQDFIKKDLIRIEKKINNIKNKLKEDEKTVLDLYSKEIKAR